MRDKTIILPAVVALTLVLLGVVGCDKSESVQQSESSGTLEEGESTPSDGEAPVDRRAILEAVCPEDLDDDGACRRCPTGAEAADAPPWSLQYVLSGSFSEASADEALAVLKGCLPKREGSWHWLVLLERGGEGWSTVSRSSQLVAGEVDDCMTGRAKGRDFAVCRDVAHPGFGTEQTHWRLVAADEEGPRSMTVAVVSGGRGGERPCNDGPWRYDVLGEAVTDVDEDGEDEFLYAARIESVDYPGHGPGGKSCEGADYEVREARHFGVYDPGVSDDIGRRTPAAKQRYEAGRDDPTEIEPLREALDLASE